MRLASLILAVLLAGCNQATPLVAPPPIDEPGLLLPINSSGVRGPTGTITGRVVDERTKTGIPDVVVEVQGVSPPVSTRTDASGNFTLPNVPQGRQMLAINKPGYVFLASQGTVMAQVTPNSSVALASIVLSPQVLASSNAYISSIGSLVEPYGLAIDNNRGFLYAVDRIGLNDLVDKRSEVKKFNLSGGFVKSFGGDKVGLEQANQGASWFDVFNHLVWAYGIDVDTGGNVYVAETTKDRVVKFSPAGEYVASLKEGVQTDYDVAVLNTGQIGVSSSGTSQVVLFEANLGGNKQLPGTAGIRGLAVDNANFLYVIDASGAQGAAVKKLDARGSKPVLQFGSNTGSGPGQFRGATNLAVDNRNGDVYVVDQGNNRVQRFDRDGRFVSEFGSAGRGGGQFDRPYGIAIDKDGFVYVSDAGNKRIQKFAPGRVTQ